MDVLGHRLGVDRFVLMGLCAGAVSAFNAARADARVIGTVLINPQGYDEDVAVFADARRYWRKVFRALIDPSRWFITIPRNASYKTMVGQLRRRLSPAPAASDLREEFCGLIERGVKVFIIFSSANQGGVAELETILGGRLGGRQGSGGLRIQTIGQATHTFDELRHQIQLLDTIEAWMQEMFAKARRPLVV
jgi:pimeloyl-ACP methyl ester carboxylesterase